jgi:hypothetical protein
LIRLLVFPVNQLGIVDDGSFRGIAWRVLLNYLPTQDINTTWSVQVPPKRDFYRQLVEQYFQGGMPSGTELRGQESKTVRNRKNKVPRKKFTTRMERLEEKQKSKEEIEEVGAVNEAATATSSSSKDVSDGKHNNKETITTRVNEVEDQLPAKFKELWKRSGITLDKMTTATYHTNNDGVDLLRLNHLVVPAFDENTPQDDFQDFLEDAMLLEEIRKDVARTMPHLLFFLEPTDDLGIKRYAALERILFLWAKLNKGVRIIHIHIRVRI